MPKLPPHTPDEAASLTGIVGTPIVASDPQRTRNPDEVSFTGSAITGWYVTSTIYFFDTGEESTSLVLARRPWRLLRWSNH